MDILKCYESVLNELKTRNLYRELRNFGLLEKSSDYVDFSTNDYLCLSKRVELLENALLYGEKYGIGATGSRLLSGNNDAFIELEKKVALKKKTEAAIVFNTGFQTNVSVLSCLLDKNNFNERPLVFFDRLNHASLYDAAFLSGCELIRYRHNDMNSLADLLKKYNSSPKSKFIVAETVFSMDGDILPIKEIVALAEKYGALIYLDEAHATGVFGENGYGLSTTVDLASVPHVVMGSFSKAVGCSGGYIACSEFLKNFIINKSRGFIYSTANSPIVLGAISAAWDLLESFDQERKQLLSTANKLRNVLTNNGFEVGTSQTQIIPIFYNKEQIVDDLKNKLFDEKIIVSAIKPPTVPPKSSRLRISLNISHSDADISLLLENLKIYHKVMRKKT